MKQILPHPLWLGPPDERDHFRHVLTAGIRAMVYLAAEEAPPMPPRDLICCRFPILDGTGNDADVVLLAVHTLTTLLKLHVPTLVHCAHGASRSLALAAAALSVLHKQSPEDCLQQVVEHHPGDVSPGLWNELTALLPSVR